MRRLFVAFDIWPIGITRGANLKLLLERERASNIMILAGSRPSSNSAFEAQCITGWRLQDSFFFSEPAVMTTLLHQSTSFFDLAHKDGLACDMYQQKHFHFMCIWITFTFYFQVLGAILLFGEGALEASPNLLLSLYIILSDWERGWWDTIHF